MQVLLKLFFLILYIFLPVHVQASQIFTQAEIDKMIKNNKGQSVSSLKGLSQFYQQKKQSGTDLAARARQESQYLKQNIINDQKSVDFLDQYIQSEKQLRYHPLRFVNYAGPRDVDTEKYYFDLQQAMYVQGLLQFVDRKRQCIHDCTQRVAFLEQQAVLHENQAQGFEQLQHVHQMALVAKYKDVVMQELYKKKQNQDLMTKEDARWEGQKKLSVNLTTELLSKAQEHETRFKDNRKKLKNKRQQAAKQEKLRLQEIQQAELRKKQEEETRFKKEQAQSERCKGAQLEKQKALVKVVAEEAAQKVRIRIEQANKKAAEEQLRLKQEQTAKSLQEESEKKRIAQQEKNKAKKFKKQVQKEQKNASAIKIQSLVRGHLACQSNDSDQFVEQEIMSYPDFLEKIEIFINKEQYLKNYSNLCRKTEKQKQARIDAHFEKEAYKWVADVLKNYAQAVCQDDYSLENLGILREQIVQVDQALRPKHNMKIAYFLSVYEEINNQLHNRYALLGQCRQNYKNDIQQLSDLQNSLTTELSLLEKIDKELTEIFNQAKEFQQNHDNKIVLDESVKIEMKRLLENKRAQKDKIGDLESRITAYDYMLKWLDKTKDLYDVMQSLHSPGSILYIGNVADHENLNGTLIGKNTLNIAFNRLETDVKQILQGQIEQNFSPEIKDVMTTTVDDLFQQAGLTDADRSEFTERVVKNAYEVAQRNRHGTFDPDSLGQLTYKKLTQHNTDNNRNYSSDQLKDLVAIQIKTIQLFLRL